MATRGCRYHQPGPVHGCGEADIARRNGFPCLDQDVAFLKVQACRSDVVAYRNGNFHSDKIIFRDRIFLNDDGIGAGRYGTAGKYPDTLPGPDFPLMGAAGGRGTNDFKRGGHIGGICGADGISIHRGNRHWRLCPAGCQVFGHNPAQCIRQADLFGGQGGKGVEYALTGFSDCEHQVPS